MILKITPKNKATMTEKVLKDSHKQVYLSQLLHKLLFQELSPKEKNLMQ